MKKNDGHLIINEKMLVTILMKNKLVTLLLMKKEIVGHLITNEKKFWYY